MAPRRFLLALALSLISSGLAHAGPSDTKAPQHLDEESALSVSQAALGQTVGGHRFVDGRGRTVRLGEFRGRPMVVSLIYTSCYHTCPMLTSHLARVVRVAQGALGKDSFSVVTIGFDTEFDTPARMRAFARERGIEIEGWRFLSTDPQTIRDLTRELGFVYFRSPKGFDHLAQTTVLDAQGRVYRQVYGENFEPPSLVEPLKQLVFGTRAKATSVSGWINGVRLFCTIYDPSSGVYRFDYSLFIGITIGFLSLTGVAVFIVRSWRNSRSSGPPASA